MRFRFDEHELTLLRSAERSHGAALAREGRPETLRAALALAKVGRKLASTEAGAVLSLAEAETELLVAAVRGAAGDVQWVGERGESELASRDDEERRSVTLAAFSMLVQQGTWRAFGLRRELEALARRLTPGAS